MLKSGKNIFQNPTTYLYVSGVVALAALIISIIAMFTNDCKKSGFGDIGANGQHGNADLGSQCFPAISGSQGCDDLEFLCSKNSTCDSIIQNSPGTCITGKDQSCPKSQPPSSDKCGFGKCCNIAENDCHEGYFCDKSQDCMTGCKQYKWTCKEKTTCAKNTEYCKDPDHGPHVAGAPSISPNELCCKGLTCENNACIKTNENPCQGLSNKDCNKNTDCVISKEFGSPQCIPKSDDSGSSGSGSSGSGSDIIINKKHINIGGNTIGGDSGSIRQNSNLPSAAPPTHHHSPPPSHSPGPSGPSDSDDLTWLWITLGSVGALVLLGLIIFFVKRKPKMGFQRPRITGFGRPYHR